MFFANTDDNKVVCHGSSKPGKRSFGRFSRPLLEVLFQTSCRYEPKVTSLAVAEIFRYCKGFRLSYSYFCLLDQKYKRGLLHYYFSDENTQHWTPHAISQTGKVVTGSTPPTSDRSNYDGDLLFCSPGDVGGKKYISSTEKRVSVRGFSLGRPIPPNSVIVTCIGLIGKLGIAASAMITNQQINALVVSQNFDHEFIYYALENFFPEYRSKVAMQTLPILSKSEFEKLMIKTPTIDVQHRISAHLSIMDRRIEQTQQELNLLCERRKGVTQQLFI